MTVRKYTVLIIDDCAEDRLVYRRYLDQLITSKCTVVEVESGEEALEHLETMQPDLMLLDYLLPDTDGLELITQLEADQKEIPPTIMLTGQGNEMVAVEAMKSGVKDYLVKNRLTRESFTTSVQNVLQQYYLESLLEKNIKQQQLIVETALKIRESLDLSNILDTVVQEVQLLLNCDRVIIYRFASDMSGDIVAESVKAGWKESLGTKVIDTCFKDQEIAQKYAKGKTLAVNDIYQEQFSQCHLNLLEDFEVKANAIVPIVFASSEGADSSRLWGLLIAHHCRSPHQWEKDEIELLDKLAVQLAIAIKQSELISNLQHELNAKKKLELELARRVQVLEASEDYIGLSNPQGHIIWNNPQMQQIMGIEKDADVSNFLISDYHPDWAADIIVKQGIPTAIAQGTWIGETALLTQDNREIPVSQLIIAHKSSQGKVQYFSTVMRNLTKQKETEESLKERARELEWVNLELVKTTALLKKRNEELDRFAYVTSHDLKAPLRAIANLASWLGEDLEDQIPEENQQQLRLMQSRVKRMDGLIQGLLEYSRVGRKNTPVKVVNVGDLIKEAIDSLSPPPGFKFVVPSNMPTIKTKVILLQQVFSNLIGNAVKYHHQDQGTIIISFRDVGTFYEFTVSDDGPGIDPQYHNRIFGIFQTLQARDTVESTGIGLSIVKKIVEDKGGKIGVKSQLGEGTAFYFTWHK